VERSFATYFPVPPTWREHRATLAKLLPADDWTTVAKAMQRFEVDQVATKSSNPKSHVTTCRRSGRDAPGTVSMSASPRRRR
jgi:hypothetical protein